jgi:hypothetical protein
VGIEYISSHPLNDVNVHSSSSTPTQLQAKPHTQGAVKQPVPDQQMHLPHEASQEEQQNQGRERPTIQMNGVNFNDEYGLNNEPGVAHMTGLSPIPPLPQLQAQPYTQAQDLNIAPVQDINLLHEAWHVVQQKQVRVKPAMQMTGETINDKEWLERDATRVGRDGSQMKEQMGKRKENMSRAITDTIAQSKRGEKQCQEFVDNRPRPAAGGLPSAPDRSVDMLKFTQSHAPSPVLKVRRL